MSKKLLVGLLSVLLAGFVIYGCGQVVEEKGGATTISGTVYAANGTTPVPGVYVWTSGSVIDDTSDENGNWTLTLPSTPDAQPLTKTVTMSVGSWIKQFDVYVEPGQDNQATKSQTTFSKDGQPDLGVLPGSFDQIEDIIVALGYGYVMLDATDFDNASYINTFEAIFLNCGCDPASGPGETNLKNFVEVEGKSLYASDWAGDYINNIWPSAVNWYNGSSSAAKVGDGDQTLVADVVDTYLQSVLGKNTATVYYDLSAWVVISSEGTGTDVLLSGDPVISFGTITLDNVPLVVKFQPAGTTKGTVIYTTFHNEAQEELVTDDARKMLENFIFNL